MATTILLSVGDGVTSDYINLNDGVNYFIVPNGVSMPDIMQGDTTREISLGILVRGTNTNTAIAALRAIYKKKNQARAAMQDLSRYQTPVTLGIQMASASEMVYFDVYDIQSDLASFEALASSNFIGVPDGPINLIVTTSLFGRGDVITGSTSSDIKANNPNNGWRYWLGEVPGDAPALAKMTFTDTSSGTVPICGMYVGGRASYALSDGNFKGWHQFGISPDVNAGQGTSTLVSGSANSFGSAYPFYNTAAISTAKWHPLAAGTIIANEDKGEFQIFGIVKQNTTLRDRLENVRYEVRNAGGVNTGAKRHTVVIRTPSTGQIGLASKPIQIRLPYAGPNQLFFYWDNVRMNTSSTVQVIHKRSDWTLWSSVSVAGASSTASPAVTLGTVEATTLAAELEQASSIRLLGRSHEDRQDYIIGRPKEIDLYWNRWHILDFGISHIPPQPSMIGGTAQPYKILVEKKDGPDISTTSPIISLSGIVFFDKNHPSFKFERDTEHDTSLRQFVVSTDQFGFSSVQLKATDGTGNHGFGSIIGQCMVGPSNTQLVFIPYGYDGEVNFENHKFTIKVDIIPRYRSIRGL